MRTKRVNTERRTGAAIVEAALVLPVALLFIFGILEYGRFLFVRNVMEHGAREGARYAVVHSHDKTTADIQTLVQERIAGLGNSLTERQVNVFMADPSTGASIGEWTDAEFGEPIAVQVTGLYRPVLSGFLFLPESINLQTTSLMGSEAN